jgi:hypothetical protein
MEPSRGSWLLASSGHVLTGPAPENASQGTADNLKGGPLKCGAEASAQTALRLHGSPCPVRISLNPTTRTELRSGAGEGLEGRSGSGGGTAARDGVKGPAPVSGTGVRAAWVGWRNAG